MLPLLPRFVEVAVQLPVAGTFHYSVPERLRDRPLVGHRALVPFGNRGVTGVVVAAADELDADLDGAKVRELAGLLDGAPLLSPELLELCLWISSYYEAPPGEVLRAALPAGTSVTASQLLSLTAAGRDAVHGGAGALPRGQRDLLAALATAGKPLPRKKLLAGRARGADVAELVERGLASYVLDAERQRVRDKSVRGARLLRPLDDPLRAQLARAPARLAVLEALDAAGGEADVATLRAAHPRAAEHLRALAKDELVAFTERTVRGDALARQPADSGHIAPIEPQDLNPAQAAAVDAVRGALIGERFAAFLLHGITGSGKTEVYLQVIAEALERGRSAIVLVPEISLTPQLAARFRARFGALVAVLHSGLSDRERYDEWHRLREGAARIALGARSAIFAPVAKLGVVVVDEEHDSSFKQEEGVRYHARDVALVRAQRAGAACVLGSATPSLESFAGAEGERLELLSLPERATGRPLPEVELIDLRLVRPDRESMLTAPLAAAIEDTLAAGDQVILFLNRRGFDTFVLCTACGESFQCPSCSVSLTYHRAQDRMLCHYCGHAKRLPERCPACSAESISRRGFGTEKITEAVAARFPGARVARLDRDVAAGVGVEMVLGQVARREVDVLVGTQMVTKGHDFPGVTLVGVLCADTGLSLPDFRASERTFQLLAQVAGRAGRGDRPGRVLVQSYRVDALAIAAAVDHDYDRFYRGEIESRRELDYPPAGHLVALRVDGPDAGAVIAQARALADVARQLGREHAPGATILGPSEAPLARLKGRTRWHLWLRARERSALRVLLRAVLARAPRQPAVRVTVDVDPISAL